MRVETRADRLQIFLPGVAAFITDPRGSLLEKTSARALKPVRRFLRMQLIVSADKPAAQQFIARPPV